MPPAPLDPEFELVEVRAKAAYEGGDLQKAVEFLLLGSAMPAADATLFFNLGMVKAELGDYLGAIDAYSRSIPEHSDAFVNRGLCFEMIGENAKARLDYDAALGVNPNEVEALINLGTLDLEEGDLQGAERRLLHAAQVDPTANWQLSHVYVANGDGAAAEAALRLAIEHGETRAIEALDELRSATKDSSL